VNDVPVYTVTDCGVYGSENVYRMDGLVIEYRVTAWYPNVSWRPALNVCAPVANLIEALYADAGLLAMLNGPPELVSWTTNPDPW
jgi:hypothetical protein